MILFNLTKRSPCTGARARRAPAELPVLIVRLPTSRWCWQKLGIVPEFPVGTSHVNLEVEMNPLVVHSSGVKFAGFRLGAVGNSPVLSGMGS